MTDAPEKKEWLILKKGRGWYRPDAKGYTVNITEAGRYSHEDALSYSHPNGLDGPRDGLTIKHESEIVIAAPNLYSPKDTVAYKELEAERDRLREALEWQPIETAPTGGTWHVRGLWVHDADTGKRKYWQCDVGYVTESGEFHGLYDDDFGWRPEDYTHWLPLPKPPAVLKGDT